MTYPIHPTTAIEHDGRSYKVQGWSEDDLIFRGLVSTKAFYELQLLNYIRSLELKGAYIDVGCNIGNHALFFACACLSDYVLGFEAVDELCVIARNNLRDNVLGDHPQWLIENFAVSDKPDQAIHIQIATSENMGRSKIADSGVYVPNIRLDDYLAKSLQPCYGEHDTPIPITLIKIDVEGFEVEVLKGAIKTIAFHKPVIVSEVFRHGGQTAIDEKNEIDTLLSPIGYKYVKGFGEGGIPVAIWRATD